MNYEKIYNELVAMASKENNREDGIYDKHHIIPKSLGGSNKKENLVNLTLRQHYVAHKLLVKFKTGKDKLKMMCALKYFTHSKKYNTEYISSRDFERIKKEHRIAASMLLSGRVLTEETRNKMSKAQKRRYEITPSHWKGASHKDETIQKIREANVGENNHQYKKPRTAEEKQKISKTMSGVAKSESTIEKFRNRKQSDETKEKIRKRIEQWWKNKNERKME